MSVLKARTFMFTVALVKVAKKRQPKYPFTNKRINKILYIHTVEYYSALKKRKL